MVFPLWSR
jgi:MsbA_lipidA: lipid A export permease/ATP-binding protein MsbA